MGARIQAPDGLASRSFQPGFRPPHAKTDPPPPNPNKFVRYQRTDQPRLVALLRPCPSAGPRCPGGRAAAGASHSGGSPRHDFPAYQRGHAGVAGPLRPPDGHVTAVQRREGLRRRPVDGRLPRPAETGIGRDVSSARRRRARLRQYRQPGAAALHPHPLLHHRGRARRRFLHARRDHLEQGRGRGQLDGVGQLAFTIESGLAGHSRIHTRVSEAAIQTSRPERAGARRSHATIFWSSPAAFGRSDPSPPNGPVTRLRSPWNYLGD